jgi:hypothetical protein
MFNEGIGNLVLMCVNSGGGSHQTLLLPAAVAEELLCSWFQSK